MCALPLAPITLLLLHTPNKYYTERCSSLLITTFASYSEGLIQILTSHFLLMV